MNQFIENNKSGKKVYDSVLVKPENINVLNSKTSRRIIDEISQEPGCAMDIARRIGEHEQKVYYHIRKLEDAGIIKKIREEKRKTMTAKIFGLTSPVIATKLSDDGVEMEENYLDGPAESINPELKRFLHPFVKNGGLNAEIIIGDSYSHGKYDKHSTEGPHIFDFALLLGQMIKDLEFPHYHLDTEVSEKMLDRNLILFGNPQTNTIIDRLNSKLPVYFDEEHGWSVVSKSTGKVYDDPRTGLILKGKNPFNPKKKILLLGGVRTRGTQAGIIAFTKNFGRVMEKIESNGNLARVVEGLDADSDKIIDSVRFLE